MPLKELLGLVRAEDVDVVTVEVLREQVQGIPNHLGRRRLPPRVDDVDLEAPTGGGRRRSAGPAMVARRSPSGSLAAPCTFLPPGLHEHPFPSRSAWSAATFRIGSRPLPSANSAETLLNSIECMMPKPRKKAPAAQNPLGHRIICQLRRTFFSRS